MNQKQIEGEIKNYKIREGPLYKRSKFLKEWRQRWIVLTMNYMFTFTNKSCQEITDVIDLKEIKSYKSYMRKDEQMIPVGFKLRTGENMFYFCARDCNEKWSWIVTLERLMDYKYTGASTYNNVDMIKTKGFDSQIQFENGGKIEKNQATVLLQQVNQKKTDVDLEAEKIKKMLEQQQDQFRRMEQEYKKRQAQLIANQNKKQEKPVEKPKEVRQQVIEPPVKSQGGGIVSSLAKQYEQKMQQSSRQTAPTYKLPENMNKKPSQLSKNDQKALSVSRSRIVSGLFDELTSHAEIAYGFKYFIDFLVRIGSDKNLGFSCYVVYESKTHENRKTFAEVFVELITDFKDYQNCVPICQFVEICIFQSAGLFDLSQNRTIKKKIAEFFMHVDNEDKLQVILKDMFIMHKIDRYEKSNQVSSKLDKLVKQCKREETRNWAQKLRDDL